MDKFRVLAIDQGTTSTRSFALKESGNGQIICSRFNASLRSGRSKTLAKIFERKQINIWPQLLSPMVISPSPRHNRLLFKPFSYLIKAAP